MGCLLPTGASKGSGVPSARVGCLTSLSCSKDLLTLDFREGAATRICLLNFIKNFRAKHCVLSYPLRVLLRDLNKKPPRIIENADHLPVQPGLLEEAAILMASNS